ncbi:MAG: hypothetical protein ACOX9C_10555 [Kiritimatiellia bacterium]
MPASRGAAGGDREDGARFERDEAAAPELKEPRFLFGRPDKDTAAEQLAHAVRLEEAGQLRGARKAYNALVHEWGEAPEAATAQLGVAALHESAGNLAAAFREYQYFIEHYASAAEINGVDYQKVVEKQFAVANSLRDKMGGWFSPNAEFVASMFRHIVDNAPEWSRAPECMLLEGSAYESEKMDAEAIVAYDALASRYPASELRDDAIHRAAACRYRISRRHSRDERTLNHALAALSRAYREAPDHPMAESASQQIAELSKRRATMLFERAEFYDRIRDNPSAALVAYEQFLMTCPASAEAPWVRDRIVELKALVASSEAEADSDSDGDPGGDSAVEPLKSSTSSNQESP